MKFHPIAVVGALLIVGGIAALIWPQLSMPAQKQEVQIGAEKAIIETRKIVTFPRPLSILLILAGAGQIFFTCRKPSRK